MSVIAGIIIAGIIIASIIILGIISGIILNPTFNYVRNTTERELSDNIDDAHKLICGISDELDVIFDKIDDISSDNLDDRAKEIYRQIQGSQDIESCDISYFFSQLDIDQKKKLKWLELSCNVRDCLTD